MKTKKFYQVSYTKKIGVKGTLNVKARNKNEAIANAKLIAAAPDLLEACIWAEKQFLILADKGLYPEHLLSNHGGSGVMPLVNAIKKATE